MDRTKRESEAGKTRSGKLMKPLFGGRGKGEGERGRGYDASGLSLM